MVHWHDRRYCHRSSSRRSKTKNEEVDSNFFTLFFLIPRYPFAREDLKGRIQIRGIKQSHKYSSYRLEASDLDDSGKL